MSDRRVSVVTLNVEVLFLVFLVLKLTGHIGWSWWWVTAPLWMAPGAIVAAAVVVGLVYLPFWLVDRARARDSRQRHRRRR